MMLRWPLIGGFSLAMVVVYIAVQHPLLQLLRAQGQPALGGLDSRIGGALADSISSNPTVKSFGAERARRRGSAGHPHAWRAATLITWNRYTGRLAGPEPAAGGAAGGPDRPGVLRWAQGKASAGDVAFVITSFLIMSGYLRNIGDNIRMLQRGLADVEDVARYARMPPRWPTRRRARLPTPSVGEIVFEDVTFRYKSADGRSTTDFSLRIAPGERLALVGPTGSGKSTFVKLLQRLYDVQGGRILIDGQDIAG
jgi:ATP-binding cassette subfamily B protein